MHTPESSVDVARADDDSTVSECLAEARERAMSEHMNTAAVLCIPAPSQSDQSTSPH